MKRLKRFWYTLIMKEAIIEKQELTYRWARLEIYKNR